MRLSATIIVFFFTFLSAFGQGNKFIIGTDGDYSVLMNENISTKSVRTKEGGYVDYYILSKSNLFVYLITITRVGKTSDPNIIYSESFRNSYAKECNCQLSAYRKASFNNFKGAAFNIKTQLERQNVVGYSIVLTKSGAIYSLNCLTLEGSFDSLKSEFDNIINSIVIK